MLFYFFKLLSRLQVYLCARRLLGPNFSLTRVEELRFPPRESITGTKGRKCVKLVYARSPELIFRSKPSAPPTVLSTWSLPTAIFLRLPIHP